MLYTMAERVGKALLEHQQTICTAESCTGGLVASALTDISGSSAYMLGGVVTYSNAAKQRLIQVQTSTLETYGAVSEETAKEMALGVRALFGADIALSVTGIAGPGGGSEVKPVGLTYIGGAWAGGVIVRRFVWDGDRLQNKRSSAIAALQLAQDILSL